MKNREKPFFTYQKKSSRWRYIEGKPNNNLKQTLANAHLLPWVIMKQIEYEHAYILVVIH